MSLLNTIRQAVDAACHDYSFEYESERMMNVRADDRRFPCVFFEEYYDATFNRKYSLRKTTTVELHFMKLAEFQDDAVERERLRAEIEQEAVVPFIETLDGVGVFGNIDTFTCVPEPPLFDANAVSLLVRLSLTYNPCAI